jgi:hypothetical protein
MPGDNSSASKGSSTLNLLLRLARRGAAIALVAIAIVLLANAGLQMRRWVWDNTQAVRFTGDLRRNFRFGLRACQEGYFNVYENVYANAEPGKYDIDYPPLRLLVFTAWVHHLRTLDPSVSELSTDWDFNASLLAFNTLTEAFSAAGAFAIVLLWIRRRDGKRGFWHGWPSASLAALMVWFSPVGMVDGHSWPSYDVWIPPFFLWGIFFSCIDLPFVAGAVIGLGAMFKGQMLLVAPLFALWPIFAGEPLRAVRWLIGFATACAVVLAPFILSSEIGETAVRAVDGAAVGWIVCVVLSPCLIWSARSLVARRLDNRWQRAAALAGASVFAILLVLWPWTLRQNRALDLAGMNLNGAAVGLGLAIAYLAMVWFLPRRAWVLTLLGAAAGALFLGMMLFPSSPAWFDVGFRYGSERFFTITVGPNLSLGSILVEDYGFSMLVDHIASIPARLLWGWPAEPIDLDVRHFLFSLYVIALVIVSIGAGLQWRSRDTRFLVAVSAIWLLFYALLPQMIGRYLLFGATAATIAVAENWGLGLMAILCSALGAIETLQCQCEGSNHKWTDDQEQTWRPLYDMMIQMHSGAAWAVLLIAAIFLYIGICPRGLRWPRALRWPGWLRPSAMGRRDDVSLPREPVAGLMPASATSI